jgi:hypothetical protein
MRTRASAGASSTSRLRPTRGCGGASATSGSGRSTAGQGSVDLVLDERKDGRAVLVCVALVDGCTVAAAAVLVLFSERLLVTQFIGMAGRTHTLVSQ